MASDYTECDNFSSWQRGGSLQQTLALAAFYTWAKDCAVGRTNLGAYETVRKTPE